MSVQIALGAPATRVASRKLGPGRRQSLVAAGERPGRLGHEHVREHVRQVRDGRQDRGRGCRRRSRSAARRARAGAGAGARRGRPRCVRSASGTRWRPRTGRRARVRRPPSRRRPADGRRRTGGRRGRPRPSRLVEPTSVTTQSDGAPASASADTPGQRRRPAPRRTRPRAPATASATSAQARSMAPRASAASSASAEASYPAHGGAGPLARGQPDRAADQPDAEDRDQHATSARPRGGAPDRRSERSSTSTVVLPAETAVGDRLAVDELRCAAWILAAADQERLQHRRRRSHGCPAAIWAATAAATCGWRSGSLPLLSWLRSIITRSGSPAAAQQRQRSGDRLAVVVRPAAATAQDDVAVAIAAGMEDRRHAVVVDAGERVAGGSGAHRVDRDLDVAVGAILEPDRHRQARAELAMDLALDRAGADRAPADRVRDVLRDDRVEELAADRQAERQHLEQQRARASAGPRSRRRSRRDADR